MQDGLIFNNNGNQSEKKPAIKNGVIKNVVVGFSSEVLFALCLFAWLVILTAIFFFVLSS
ncbi:MAG TPA: hypothetical protein PL190_03555 [Caldisericia bacterium]|jgi:hypothetical protein|nr:MAG: hypothetical protein BWX90_00223 [bacterium ADurb.Bin132]HNY61048.1 hypothetical protein [Caldisericia bacterium]HOC78981.1 hypothetical protein [Caldisericia bacterium]HOG69768.1 hypothetical protein [Caldisericia bacterium]HPA65588.1 hypothetical protein [Caldisericia bacterium]